MSTRPRWRAKLLTSALMLAMALPWACTDATDVRLLELAGAGVVSGVVSLDSDGDGSIGTGDAPIAEAQVSLAESTTGTVIDNATTDSLGRFALAGVPVGDYTLLVDSAVLGDSLDIFSGAGPITVALDDTVRVALGVSFPHLALEDVPSAPIGSRIFTRGIALNARPNADPDGEVHFKGSSGYLRALNVERGNLNAGDSVRILGRVTTDNGRPALDDVTRFVLVSAATGVTPIDVSTGTASTASGGSLDAALVRIRLAELTDTSTNVDGDFRFWSDDGSDSVEVVIRGFLTPGINLSLFRPDTIVRIHEMTGLLSPYDDGAGSIRWRLLPRTAGDILLENKLADVAVSTAFGAASANVGDTVQIVVVATSNGPVTATSVQVRDTLPTGVGFLSAASTSGIYSVVTGLWDLGSMPVGTTDTLRINVVVAGGAPSTIVNVAQFLGLVREVDTNSSNNSASASLSISTPDITANGTTVGAGLQLGSFSAVLGSSTHGGVTVRFQSADPSVMLLSPNATTAGTPFIDVFVANGQNQANYFVQGVEGTTGTVSLTVSAPGFTSRIVSVTVLTPALDLAGIPATLTTFSPDDAFQVRLGLPNALLTGLSSQQAVRAGGPAVTATVTSSAPGVGDLVTLPDSTSPVAVSIAPGQSQSASSVAAGGVAFEAISAGTATLTATIPGFIATDAATADVLVTAPGIGVNAATVGAGLQAGTFTATLGTSVHGGVTVRLQSANPSVVLLSPDATTSGTSFIDVFVPNGQSQANYYVQGVGGTTGVVPLNASAPGFTSNSADITVVQPWVDISGLLPSETTLSSDDDFQVRVGLPDGGATQVAVLQAVRIGGAALTATVTSSNAGVGVIKTTGNAGAVLSLAIPPGSASTPGSVAAGGFAFDPLGPGTTTVTAAIPGVQATANAAQSVTVSPGISVSGATVGAGLQDGSFNAVLGTSTHGGVTVRLQSANPSVMLVSPDAATAGTAFIDVFVPDGMNQASYFVQGVEGTTGSVPLSVSAPGFASNVANISVVPPALDIASLNASYLAAAVDDPFWVRVGVANGGGTAVGAPQAVRTGGGTLTATITSSNPSAAQLVTSSASGGTIVLQIVQGQSTTPLTVGAGGVAIDPLVVGSTTVTATIPGLTATAGSAQTVTINP